MDRIEALKKHYEPRIDKYKENSKVLDWESSEAQLKRFKVMIDNVNIRNKTILDVGCGCGDLYGILKNTDKTVNYTGVDIIEIMIKRASLEYPEASFFCTDIFSKVFDLKKQIGFAKFDIIFASGIFNLQAGNNKEFLKKAIPILASLAREVFIFNLLNPKSPNLDNNYFYYPPGDAVKLAEPFAEKIYLIKNYLKNDYTLLCWKNDEQI